MPPVTRSRQFRHTYRTRRNTGPLQSGTRRYSTSHQRVNQLEELVDLSQAENLLSQAPTSIMPKGKNVTASGGYVEYGAIAGGQRSRVEAVITSHMIGQGSRASYRLPFFRYKTGHLIVRGHILANVLGGSGSNPRNIVPIYHSRNNLPMYKDVEHRIKAFVERGGSVLFEANVLYTGRVPGSPMSVFPVALQISAKDLQRGNSILSASPVTIELGF